MYIRLTIALCLLSYGYAQKGKGRPPSTPAPSPPATTAAPSPPATTAAPGPTTTGSSGGVSTFCSDVMSDPSDSVSANSYCGDDAEGYMEVCEDGDDMYILSSGAPNHPAEYDQVTVNPNTRCEIWQYIKVSKTWVDSGSTTQEMGVVGYVTSGGTYFDARSSPAGDSAILNEGDSLDPYYGHSNNANQYHYHAIPTYYESAADASACQHIGYMIDGGKLYGYCEVDGVQLAACYYADSTGELDYVGIEENESDYTYNSNGSDCHLDECNMYELNGEMVYITSANWPFVPPCMKGSVATINGFTPSVRP